MFGKRSTVTSTRDLFGDPVEPKKDHIIPVIRPTHARSQSKEKTTNFLNYTQRQNINMLVNFFENKSSVQLQPSKEIQPQIKHKSKDNKLQSVTNFKSLGKILKDKLSKKGEASLNKMITFEQDE